MDWDCLRSTFSRFYAIFARVALKPHRDVAYRLRAIGECGRGRIEVLADVQRLAFFIGERIVVHGENRFRRSQLPRIHPVGIIPLKRSVVEVPCVVRAQEQDGMEEEWCSVTELVFPSKTIQRGG